jgi:hypothetical protein
MMTMRRSLVIGLALVLALLPGISVAQQGTGVISGKATDQVKSPYDGYAVVLRNVQTGQAVATRPLDRAGLFSFPDVPLNQRYLVELVQAKQNKVICTEGPFGLVTGEVTSITGVNIDCKKSNTLMYVIIGGLGTAAFLGTSQASGSR